MTSAPPQSLAASDGSLRAQLFRGVIGTAGAKGLYLLIQFALGVALARLLGPKALGIYAIILAIVQLISIVSEFGLPSYLIRTISLHRVNGAASASAEAIVGSLESTLVLALLFVLLVVSVPLFIPWLIPAAIPQTTLILGLALLPLNSLSNVSSGAIQGLGHVILAQLPNQIIRPATALVGLLVLMTVSGGVTVNNVLLVQWGAALIALLTGFRLIHRHATIPLFKTARKFQHVELLRRSLPFLLLASAQVLNYQTAVLVLGTLATGEEVGSYRVALQLADALGIALYAISAVIAPQLARLYGESDLARIQEILTKSHRAATLAVLLPAIPIALYASALLSFIFGQEYLVSTDTLKILLIGKVLYATVAFSGLALSMLGAAHIAALVTLASAVLNVVLGINLIPKYGIEGAAMASIVSQIATNILGIYYMRLNFGSNFSAFGWRKA